MADLKRRPATEMGIVPNPTLFDHFYTYAWFVTFALSSLTYLGLMKPVKMNR